MAVKKSSAEECCAKCESDISALRKEILSLKKSKGSGGKDPRVEILVEWLLSKYPNDNRSGKEATKLTLELVEQIRNLK